MKKLLAIILVLTMALSYTVFAEEDFYEEDYYEEIIEEIPPEEYIEETISEDDYEGGYEGESYESSVPVTNKVENSTIKVYVDSRRILFDTEPEIVNGRTMVPVRAIFEALGATVTWDNSTRTAIGVLGDTTVKITIGQSYLTKNGEIVALDSPAYIKEGRTYVPARAIAESFDCTVDWDNNTRTVTIRSK